MRWPRIASALASAAVVVTCLVPTSAFAAGAGQVNVSIPSTVPLAVLSDGRVVGPSADKVTIRNNSMTVGVQIKSAKASYESGWAEGARGDNGVSMTWTPSNGAKALTSANMTTTTGQDTSTDTGMHLAASGKGISAVSFAVAGTAGRLAKGVVTPQKLATVTWDIEADPVYLMVYDKADGTRVAELQYGSMPDDSVGKLVKSYEVNVDQSAGSNTVQPWFDINTGKADEVVSGVKTLRFRDRLTVPGARTFAGWTSLTSADLTNYDSTGVNSFAGLFSGDSSLVNIKGLGALDVSSVKSLYATFNGCSSLRDLSDISNWNIDNVKTLYYTFFKCSSLTSLDLSKWNTSNVTTLYGTFALCTSLTSVGDLSAWDVKNVETLMYTFYGCSNLVSLNLSKWNTSNVTSLDATFDLCTSLTSVGDLSKWNVGNVTSMDHTFWACVKLATLGNLSKWDTSKVTTFRSVFSSGDVNKYGYMLLDAKSLGVESWDTSSATNLGFMFYGFSATKSLDLSKWDVSKVRSLYFTFFHNKSLVSITGLDRWKTTSLETTDGMFAGCNTLVSVDLSGWDTSKVRDMSQMFESCASLKSVSGLNGFDTTKVLSFREMFYGCRSLQSLDLSSFSTESISYDADLNGIGGMSNNTKNQSYGLLNMFGVEDENALGISQKQKPSPMVALRSIKLGPRFDIHANGGDAKGAASLPTPSKTYIPGADGNWYDAATGTAYTVKSVPSKKAVTLVAVKSATKAAVDDVPAADTAEDSTPSGEEVASAPTAQATKDSDEAKADRAASDPDSKGAEAAEAPKASGKEDAAAASAADGDKENVKGNSVPSPSAGGTGDEKSADGAKGSPSAGDKEGKAAVNPSKSANASEGGDDAEGVTAKPEGRA